MSAAHENASERLQAQYWTRPEGELSRLGLQPDFAESLSGDWVGLELAPEGAVIRPGETFGFVTTDRATHDLRAPFGFRIVEVNQSAIENAPIVRLSPTGAGWLLNIKPIENWAVA